MLLCEWRNRRCVVRVRYASSYIGLIEDIGAGVVVLSSAVRIPDDEQSHALSAAGIEPLTDNDNFIGDIVISGYKEIIPVKGNKWVATLTAGEA